MAISGLGSGVGATLAHDGTYSDTYAQVLTIAVAGMTCDVTDISSAGSASQFMEFLPGLLNAGSITLVLRYGTTLGTAAETETATLQNTYRTRQIDTWTLTIPGGAAGGTWACTGFIQRVGMAVNYRGGVQQPVVIKLTGIPTWTAAS